MTSVHTDESPDVSSGVDQEHWHHYCRGCGRILAFGFRGHFHRECLRTDKRRRMREQRQREHERFSRWLNKQRCPNCGAKYREKRSDHFTEVSCEASQPTQDRD